MFQSYYPNQQHIPPSQQSPPLALRYEAPGIPSGGFSPFSTLTTRSLSTEQENKPQIHTDEHGFFLSVCVCVHL